MQKWEYTTCKQGRLKLLGAEGWEAVGIASPNLENFTVLLKRPIPDEDGIEVSVTQEYGVWLGADDGWLQDASGRIITGSFAAMHGTAMGMDASWKAHVQALPTE